MLPTHQAMYLANASTSTCKERTSAYQGGRAREEVERAHLAASLGPERLQGRFRLRFGICDSRADRHTPGVRFFFFVVFVHTCQVFYQDCHQVRKIHKNYDARATRQTQDWESRG